MNRWLAARRNPFIFIRRPGSEEENGSLGRFPFLFISPELSAPFSASPSLPICHDKARRGSQPRNLSAGRPASDCCMSPLLGPTLSSLASFVVSPVFKIEIQFLARLSAGRLATEVTLELELAGPDKCP